MWTQSGNITEQPGVIFKNHDSKSNISHISVLRKRFEISLVFSLTSPLQTRYVDDAFHRLDSNEKRLVNVTMDLSRSIVAVTTSNQQIVPNILELALENVEDKSIIDVLTDLLHTTMPKPGFVMS